MEIKKGFNNEIFPLGKSGRDQFSRSKTLTIVMIPYERFSPFAKAVDDLYRNIEIPFNLIVVEGNAPEVIRAALEKRQRQHRNITIVYSRHRPSITGAINLAIPHVKTPYAFIMDNDVRVPKGVIPELLESAERNGADMVVPKNCFVEREIRPGGEEAFSSGASGAPQEFRTLGIRSCFLVSSHAIEKLGRFDEDVSPLTAGADITLMAKRKSLRIVTHSDACLEASSDEKIKSFDADLFTFQWNPARNGHALQHFREKWGVELLDSQYRAWIEEKQKKATLPKGLHLNDIVSNISTAVSAASRSAAELFAQVSGVKVRD